MNVPVVSHLKLLVNLYNKMNNRFLVLLVIYLIIYLLSVLYKNKQIFCAILLSLLSWERGLKYGNRRCISYNRSLLSWERGLKSKDYNYTNELMSSLLSWERGLKYYAYVAVKWTKVVAPLVGAWIEISSLAFFIALEIVAPLVGAWIEIRKNSRQQLHLTVAPLVGAWIEIIIILFGACRLVGRSLLSWERGLKYRLVIYNFLP